MDYYFYSIQIWTGTVLHETHSGVINLFEYEDIIAKYYVIESMGEDFVRYGVKVPNYKNPVPAKYSIVAFNKVPD